MSSLPEKDQQFCSWIGLSGLGISVTCLLQHLGFMNYSVWMAYAIIPVYIFSIIAFSLLIAKSPAAPVCILISAILVFLDEVYVFLTLTFSLILLMLVLYSVVVTVLVYVNGLPARLRQFARQQRSEDDFWKDKL